MLNKYLLSNLSFLVAGAIGLLCALFISTKVVRVVNSQEIDSTASVEVASPPAEVVAPPTLPSPEVAAPSVPTESATAAPVTSAPATTPPIPEGISFLEPYVFDIRAGRRNPFLPPQLVEGTPADMMLPGTPLERYDLNELKLVGIMWDVVAPKAMLIDPQGEVHVLGKDDRIGRKRGYVAVIREGEVVVVETSSFNGENTYATRVLRIDK